MESKITDWLKKSRYNITLHRLFHRVAHKGSKILRCNGSVRLGHKAVRPLPCALCEDIWDRCTWSAYELNLGSGSI